MSNSPSKRWCFTTNNYNEDDIAKFKNVECLYIVIGFETSTSGTPHLQGFVTFKEHKRLSAMKKICSKSHWEQAKGTSVQASDYCKKTTDYYERGNAPLHGRRNDLEKVYEQIRAGASDLELADQFPGQWTRYYKAFARYRSMLPVSFPSVSPYPLRDWQQELNGLLNGTPSDREIIFVVDRNGASGKSWFAKYYASLHPGKVQILKPGKKADMAYELRTDIRVLFMDCPRSRSEVLDYEFLESLKDQMVFSGKYESTTKKFDKPLHVAVLMNEQPLHDKLSRDRYRSILPPQM